MGSRSPRRKNLDIKDSDLEIERCQAAIDTLLLNYWGVNGNFHFFKFIDSFPDHQEVFFSHTAWSHAKPNHTA